MQPSLTLLASAAALLGSAAHAQLTIDNTPPPNWTPAFQQPPAPASTPVYPDFLRAGTECGRPDECKIWCWNSTWRSFPSVQHASGKVFKCLHNAGTLRSDVHKDINQFVPERAQNATETEAATATATADETEEVEKRDMHTKVVEVDADETPAPPASASSPAAIMPTQQPTPFVPTPPKTSTKSAQNITVPLPENSKCMQWVCIGWECPDDGWTCPIPDRRAPQGCLMWTCGLPTCAEWWCSMTTAINGTAAAGGGSGTATAKPAQKTKVVEVDAPE